MSVPADLPHVVIVGGGFAGLKAARSLRRAPVRVTLVDKQNHHLFQPLLYQVATGALAAPDIAAPIRKVLRNQKNATVLVGEVQSVDRAAKEVVLEDGGGLPYDYLLLATGASHAYFGHDEWAEHAPGLKTLSDAFHIRRRVLSAFEAAERESDPLSQRELLTFVVVGGGPTGVELAGALAEIARRTLARDFRNFDPREACVVLIEALPQILNAYPEDLSAKAVKQLERLGVVVKTGIMVTGVDEAGVSIEGGRIAARTILWAAGVEASKVGAHVPGAALHRTGRVLVQPDLAVDDAKDVFVAGDLAWLEEDDKPVPALAPVALQMGRHFAGNVLRLLEGRPTESFHYKDRGSLATIGRSKAVGLAFGVKLWGFPAWITWLVVHLFFLVGFRNRWAVVGEWAWAYLTFQWSARVMVDTRAEVMRLKAVPPQRAALHCGSPIATLELTPSDGEPRQAPSLPR
jgi:NADH:ubiquinone reductase (H+-translocating)